MYSIVLKAVLVTRDADLAATLPVDLEVSSQGRVRVSVEEELRQGFDVALVDLGREACSRALERLQERAPATPLVVLLPEENHEVALEALRQGAEDCLTREQVEGLNGYRALRYAVERARAARLKAWSAQQQGRIDKMEAVGRLAAGIVHDFRHLVQIVVGHCGVISRHYADDAHLQEWLGEVRVATDRARALVDRLLRFVSEGDGQPTQVQVADTLDRIRLLLKPLLGHRVSLEVHQDNQGELTIWAEESELDQVLLNLGVNALDAMPSGGKLLLEARCLTLRRVTATRHCQLAAGSYAVLSISDTGQGMSRELLERALEPFFTTKAHRGTGLGLSTAFTLLVNRGGGLTLASEPGAGTTASTFIPLADQELEELPRLEGLALLLDPDDLNRTWSRLELESLGYRVLEARNLDEVSRLASLVDEPITLALVDSSQVLGCASQLEELLPEARPLSVSDFSPRWLRLRGWLPPGWEALQRPWSAHDLGQSLATASPVF